MDLKEAMYRMVFQNGWHLKPSIHYFQLVVMEKRVATIDYKATRSPEYIPCLS